MNDNSHGQTQEQLDDYFRVIAKDGYREAEKKLGIPRSTLYDWVHRNQDSEDRFAAIEKEVNPSPQPDQGHANITVLASVDVMPAFTSQDEEDYKKFEKIIRAGSQTFFEVGWALLEIKKRQLYLIERKDGEDKRSYTSWEEYCLDQWRCTDSHANRQIAAYKVVDQLRKENGQDLELLESQVRPLVGHSSEFVSRAWKKVQELAKATPKKQITGSLMNQAVREVAGKKVSKPTRQKGVVLLRKKLKEQLFALIKEAEEAISNKNFELAGEKLQELRTKIGSS